MELMTRSTQSLIVDTIAVAALVISSTYVSMRTEEPGFLSRTILQIKESLGRTT
jgi:hypothetical protein